MQDSYKSPQSSTARRTPSISPLSTTSKTHNDSVMASTGLPNPLVDAARTLLGDRAEIEEKDATGTTRERSSSLSDIDASLSDEDAVQSESEEESIGQTVEDDDSEAETERIKPTPQKGLGTVIKTLAGDLATVAEDVTSDSERLRNARESRTSRQPLVVAGRKRKRGMNAHNGDSRVSDETDSDAGVLKKRGLWQTALVADPDADIEPDDLEKNAEEEYDGLGTAPSSPSKDQLRKGRTTARGSGREVQVESEAKDQDVPEEADDVEEADEDKAEELDPEEVGRRDDAFALISAISGRFGSLKSKVHTDRIAEAEAELAQLHLLHPIHPEYIRQLQAVTARRDTKIQQETKLLFYKKQTLRTSTLANRAQLLSQYTQDARTSREAHLYDLGKQWYDIQRGRREMQVDELDPNVEAIFPTKRSTQIRHQTQYNAEVSILAGVAKYVGFPAAPDIQGVREKQLDDDLKAMQIPKRQVQPAPVPEDNLARAPPLSVATPAHLAHEEFLKHTPWANPYHPVHSQSRTPSAFGHRGPQPQATPQFAVLHRPTSTFNTPQIGADKMPNSDKAPPGSNETIGMLSDPPSSVIAAPPTVDRIRLVPFENDTSPLAHLKRAGAGSRRDFSGLSGTSTIDAPTDGTNVATEDRAQSVPFGALQQQAIMAGGSAPGRELHG